MLRDSPGPRPRIAFLVVLLDPDGGKILGTRVSGVRTRMRTSNFRSAEEGGAVNGAFYGVMIMSCCWCSGPRSEGWRKEVSVFQVSVHDDVDGYVSTTITKSCDSP